MITITVPGQGQANPMVNRREFFGRFMKGGASRPRRRRNRQHRCRELETFLVVDVIPDDMALSEAQEMSLRAAARSLLERTSDDDLFSTLAVTKIEELGARYIQEIEGIRDGRQH
jgi:hypothetical protein